MFDGWCVRAAAVGPVITAYPELLITPLDRTITISGTGFHPDATVEVDLGPWLHDDVSATVVRKTATSVDLHVISPALGAQYWVVSIANPDGQTAYANFIVSRPGLYYPVPQHRVYDSRLGAGPIGPGQTRRINVTGTGPNDVPFPSVHPVSAVVVNLTATGNTASTYLTAYAGGSNRPDTSLLNLASNDTRANLATVPVAADGTIEVYNHAGSTQVVIDVVGFYAPAGLGCAVRCVDFSAYWPLPPERFYDSRTSGEGPDRAAVRSVKHYSATC